VAHPNDGCAFFWISGHDMVLLSGWPRGEERVEVESPAAQAL
jgi:hypothetical protein